MVNCRELAVVNFICSIVKQQSNLLVLYSTVKYIIVYYILQYNNIVYYSQCSICRGVGVQIQIQIQIQIAFIATTTNR